MKKKKIAGRLKKLLRKDSGTIFSRGLMSILSGTI
jgi:hypothetical protein